MAWQNKVYHKTQKRSNNIINIPTHPQDRFQGADLNENWSVGTPKEEDCFKKKAIEKQEYIRSIKREVHGKDTVIIWNKNVKCKVKMQMECLNMR